MKWKEFFLYTKAERRAVCLLLVLIGVAGALPWFAKRYLAARPPEAVTEQDRRSQAEYEAFLAKLQETASESPYGKTEKRTYTPREIRLASFDPNTADSASFVSLGLPPWMASNILRYRRKQGKFRRPEDFRKIYGLTEEQYRTLLPYIHIAPLPAPADTVGLLAERPAYRDSVFKYPAGTLVSLNQADTTELKKIPGIGSAIARMIVNYRQRLGGFHHIEQLQDIRLKAELLRPWLVVDTTFIRPVNINRASLSRLMQHPYLNFYQAKVIVEHRKKRGDLSSLKQLSLYEEFSAEDLRRISPYVTFRDEASQ